MDETVKRKRGWFENRPRFVEELPDYNLFYPVRGQVTMKKALDFSAVL